MSGLDNIILDWFSKLFNSTYVVGLPIGKFVILSIIGVVAAELYSIRNRKGVRK